MINNFNSIFAGTVLIMLVGCQVISGDRTIGEYSSDSAITSSVKTALVDSRKVAISRIHVATNRGVVLLSGFVKSPAEKYQAGRIAAQVNGVKTVQNKLVVHPN
ncbi:BON domain-containing protein [Legionella dresdenensis]|uniref:BON domain-containing protein n=1 Tax=Legionella dresdenensis TaxID=450200 RepID=A0ABV8CI83_9GAMM